MNIQYRKLLSKDSMSYRAIRLECLKNYPENFGSNYNDEVKKEKLFFQLIIETPIPDVFVMGAFDAQELIAICSLQRYDTEKTKHRARIMQVYVTPEYQRQNIATQIIKATIGEALKIQNLEQIELGVITTNSNAESIYKKLGFEEYGIQKGYLKINNTYYDHKMMVLFLNDYYSK